ncbi:helix-turn-helix transcriptional regulator [Martelella sp. FOR1707]
MGKTLLTGNQPIRSHAYGDALGAHLGLKTPLHHISHTLNRGTLAITELQSQKPPQDPTPSFGYDEAYQVIVNFRLFELELRLSDGSLWEDAFHAGKTYIADLRQEPRVLIKAPFHTVNFYMPIASLKAYADEHDIPAFVAFPQSPTTGHDDLTMRQLASAALTAFAYPHRASGLLLDAILGAVSANLLGHYGVWARAQRSHTHGLALWQERRAKELMDERLNVSMSELAEQCGLSVGHFSRAFKRSVGVAPHQWQLARRMTRARALLSGSRLTIAEIALICGYSSQSHFHAAFKENTGVSPGYWRRSGLTRPGGGSRD